MFVFPQRLGKISLFFFSCFALSKRPQLGEVGDPYLLCFVQSRAAPACSRDALQGNANLPRFAYFSPACGSPHREIHKSDTLWRLARRDVLPGRSRTHVPSSLLMICVPGQSPLRILCEDTCWCSSYSHCSFLHGKGQEQSLWPCQSLSGDTCTNQPRYRFIFSPEIRGIHAGLCAHGWTVGSLCHSASRLPLAEPEFGCLENLCPRASTVAQDPFKTGVSGPHEEVDKRSPNLWDCFVSEVF